jgi:hypothetical protein
MYIGAHPAHRRSLRVYTGTAWASIFARNLFRRPPREDLAPAARLPDDTRLWAALQDVGGGTSGGCVYDVDAILEVLAAGRKALGR